MLRRLIVAAIIIELVVTATRARERRSIDRYVTEFTQTFLDFGRDSFEKPTACADPACRCEVPA